MRGEGRLNVRRVDLGAAAVDHVVGPAEHVQVSLVVAAGHVAGVQPSVAQGGRGGPRVSPISAGDHRSGNQQLTLVRDAAGVIDDSNPGPRHGAPYRTGAGLAVVEHRHQPGGFRHPVHVVKRHVGQPVSQRGDRHGRHRRAAEKRRPQGWEPLATEPGMT